MTSKEKAKELFIIYYAKVSGMPIAYIKKYFNELKNNNDLHYKTAKECAVICVNEIVNEYFRIQNVEDAKLSFVQEIDYWNYVILEINKM